MSAEAPRSIGPYTVIAPLDRSGAEGVYKVRDAGGRMLALKLYPAGESDDLRAFRRAALEPAMSLQHPGLIRYQQVGEHDGRVFAAMELMPGAVPLRHPLPLQVTLRIMRQVADALVHLHQQGRAHGCLNPQRVLVSGPGDAVKLTETGMCTETRPAALDVTAAMQVSRLSRYLAPELLRGASPDARSDIYSFGLLFYETLTGKLPASRFRLPSQESAEVPPELDEVVLRCLRQEPAARYGDAREVLAAIDGARANLSSGIGDHLDTLKSSARGVLGGGTESTSPVRTATWLVLGAAVVVVVALLAMRACA
jgi:serine/threonine-protein kinase